MKKYKLGLYEKAMPNELDLKAKLIEAKNAGFDYLEMSIDETDEKLKRLEMSKEERKKLVDLMFELDMPIRTICLSGHRKFPLGSETNDVANKALWIMEKAIELAYDLGIRIIQIAGYDVYYEEGNEKTKENFKENLKKCVEMASGKGIILGFETMETEFMNTINKAMVYVNEINSPYLQVYPDCGNVMNATKEKGISLVEDFMCGKGHLVAVHLKETVPGKFREITFGEGHVDFEEVIGTALELGVRMFTTEFWYVGNENWREVLKTTKKFMDKKFKNTDKKELV